MRQTVLLLLYLFFVPVSIAGEVIVKNSYSIPEGSFVELKEFRYSNYYCIKLHYDKFDNGIIYEYEVLRVYDDDTIGYMQPIYYKNTEVKVFEYLELQGYVYNPFTGEVSPVTENETAVTDNDSDGLDNVVTTEKVVYLNRIELYLLWILCVQAISCGVLLFLCFKGFEKV
jgi:hypothetical protein